MSAPMTRLDIAELNLVIIGTLVILCALVEISRRRQWIELLRIPQQPVNTLEAVDLVVGLATILLLPSIFYRLLFIVSATVTRAPGSDDVESIDPKMVLAMALGQAAGVAVLIFLCRQRFRDGVKGWGLTLDRFGARFVQAFVGYLAVWPICFGLLYLAVFLIELVQPDFEPPEHTAILTLLSRETPTWLMVVTVASAAVLAPALEELFFRGLAQPMLIRWTGKPWLSIVLAGVTFGFFHYPLVHTIPALALFGVFLGFLYARTRSLTLTILLHVAFNGKTLLWLAMGAE